MNQEKIMKAKMITAILAAIAALIAVFVFAGLYYDKCRENRAEYIRQFKANITEAAEEIDKYTEKGTDLELHYNMVISDLGAARAMIFLVSDCTDEQKTINELHYCFVKYPVQMRDRLSETAKALHDTADDLDMGYEELRSIIDSVDRLGE